MISTTIVGAGGVFSQACTAIDHNTWREGGLGQGFLTVPVFEPNKTSRENSARVIPTGGASRRLYP
ncbi:MAG: hypothetical protein JST36_00150 [Bacteroidetes bacterium]|nr:hypothetical protein [Bacteroidota bacterium]